MKAEAEKLQYLTDAFWCCSCLCNGYGLSGLTPCWDVKQKLCCYRVQGTSSEECCGDQGLCSGMHKFLCLMQMCEVMPDPCMCAVCNAFVIGEKPTGVKVGESLGQMEQETYMKNTFWCLYCLCTGCGCTSPTEPVLIKGTAKFLCCKNDCETDDCCGTEGTTDSCCYLYNKLLCCKHYYQCLPAMSMTPGCGLCNIMCCMNQLASTTTTTESQPGQAPNQLSMANQQG